MHVAYGRHVCAKSEVSSRAHVYADYLNPWEQRSHAARRSLYGGITGMESRRRSNSAARREIDASRVPNNPPRHPRNFQSYPARAAAPHSRARSFEKARETPRRIAFPALFHYARLRRNIAARYIVIRLYFLRAISRAN